MERKHNKLLTPRAKELRKNMTPQERKLWYEFLRTYPIRVIRQKVIDHYIADFYCAKAKLVIELDGSQHYVDEGLKYDEERTSKFKNYGIEGLRFSNRDIDCNFAGVCEYIKLKIEERTGSPA